MSHFAGTFLPYTGLGPSTLQQPLLQTIGAPPIGAGFGAVSPVQQQIQQWLQVVPQYLHQVQQLQYQQLQQIQQLLQIIPAHLQQVQHLVQSIGQQPFTTPTQPWQSLGSSLPGTLGFGLGGQTTSNVM